MRLSIKKLASGCLSGILAFAALAGISSCEKSGSLLGGIDVTLTVPSEYASAIDLSAVEVTVFNTSDLSTTKLNADADGKVSFTDVVAGTYNVSAAATVGETSFTAVSNGVAVLSQQTAQVTLTLEPATTSKDLVIKEIFYSGENVMAYDPAFTMGTMMKDFFIEIFNNSDSPVSLDGLYIGEAWTPATNANFERTLTYAGPGQPDALQA